MKAASTLAVCRAAAKIGKRRHTERRAESRTGGSKEDVGRLPPETEQQATRQGSRHLADATDAKSPTCAGRANLG
jgi:hypothetical protein